MTVSAQLTRSAPTNEREAPGVKLSEIATFRNNEIVPYTILPYGDDFFLHTYVEQFGGQGLLGGGQMLDDLWSLRLYRYDQNLKQSGAIQIAWPDEQRDHLSLSSLGDRLLWTLTIAVFDNYGEVVSLKRQRLRCDRDQLEVQSVAVDNDGRAYVLAKVYANSQRRETGGGSDSKVYLYTLDPGAEALERVEMKLGGQYIEGISMVPGREGNPAIVGVYTERRGGRIVGYFSTDNPRKGEILKPVPFSQKLLQSLGTRITAKRRGQLVMEGDFEFRDAIRLTNGKLTILLESFDVRSNNMGGVGVGPVGNVGSQFTYIFGEGVMRYSLGK